MKTHTYTPLLLVVVDGWGIAPDGPENPISHAETPCLDHIVSHYATFALGASGEYIGLASGALGNSEIGHLTISAGRIIENDNDEPVRNCIPEALSHAAAKQFYIAETKKYGHIAYYFNGRMSQSFPDADYLLVQGDHTIDYAKHARMKTPDVAQKLMSVISQGKYQFLMTNFPNIDAVAHTGNFEATTRACEYVDRALQKFIDVVLSCGGVAVIVSDHGNGEQLHDGDAKEANLNHTTNPVPCCIVGQDFVIKKPSQELCELKVSGSIARVAPTVLELLNLEIPPEMDQKSLLADIKN